MLVVEFAAGNGSVHIRLVVVKPAEAVGELLFIRRRDLWTRKEEDTKGRELFRLREGTRVNLSHVIYAGNRELYPVCCDCHSLLHYTLHAMMVMM